MRVTFFLAGEGDLDALRRLDPDREPQRFLRGEHAWTLQTYLRLRNAGHAVELSDETPDDGLVVFHVKQRDELMRRRRRGSRAVLVAIRADNRRNPIADFEVLQNDCYAAPGRRFFVPFWPQPGILPRDAARGSRIQRIAYRGFAANLDPRFLAADFRAALERQGVEFRVDSVPFTERAEDQPAVGWNDYRNVDLSLAVRPAARHLHTGKPATKLYNSWLAGVPSLLGPEYAFRALRRSPLDYLEISSPAEALAAIAELRADPARYLAMIDNGIERGQEFTAEAAVERWVDLLYRTLPPLADEPRVRRWRGRSLRVKKAVKRLLPFLDRR